MAARNRPRNGAIKDERDDAREERSMWESIIKDLEKVRDVNAKAKATSLLIIEKEENMGKNPSARELGELEELYRANKKHCDEEQRLLNHDPADLIKNLGILQALRTASEAEPPRVIVPSKVRKPKVVAPKVEVDTGTESPYPSPGPLSSASRFKGNTARSGSVASTRDGKETKEPVVKIEEGMEGVKGPPTERAAGKLVVGAEVAYRQAKMKEDGSQWIQCIIIQTYESKGKRVYEVQDPEPDENGAPGQVYKANPAALIAIPTADAPLPEHTVGKSVLARYPETTTFYRAEVTKITKDTCKLKFEDDQNQELEVDRRYVLDFNQK